jgi:hypothetical protein
MLPFGGVMALLMVACWFWGPHVSRVDYMAGLRAKHARLDMLDSPKVIIIGGSNATFGIDGRLLEQALCKPVVNMTIHASLGLRFMVDEVKASIGPGDIVIAPLEHSAYSKPVQDNDMHLLAVDFNPELIKFIPWWLRPKVIVGVLVLRMQAAWKVINGAWKNSEPHAYFRGDGFSPQGDLITHLDLGPWPLAQQERVQYRRDVMDPAFLSVIKPLQEELDRNDGRLILAWPAVAATSFRPLRSDSLSATLAHHGLAILGKAEDYVQPDTAFLETHYHLRAAGRELRTRQLIRDLCRSEQVVCCDPQR